MTKVGKIEKAKTNAPVFRNTTEIDQVVYDSSLTPINIPPGKTIRGVWWQRYAGKTGPLRLVKETRRETDTGLAGKAEKGTDAELVKEIKKGGAKNN